MLEMFKACFSCAVPKVISSNTYNKCAVIFPLDPTRPVKLLELGDIFEDDAAAVWMSKELTTRDRSTLFFSRRLDNIATTGAQQRRVYFFLTHKVDIFCMSGNVRLHCR